MIARSYLNDSQVAKINDAELVEFIEKKRPTDGNGLPGSWLNAWSASYGIRLVLYRE